MTLVEFVKTGIHNGFLSLFIHFHDSSPLVVFWDNFIMEESRCKEMAEVGR